MTGLQLVKCAGFKIRAQCYNQDSGMKTRAKSPKSKVSTVELIGAPTDVGAGARGGSMGPEALRVAGLAQALQHLGYRVLDQGNIAGPPNPVLPPEDGYRHLEETAVWCEKIRDQVYKSLKKKHIPVMMGGDHSLAIGSVAGISQYCAENDKPLSILWLDAHADFNTPKTSPSGNLHGMPAAVIAGIGHPRLLKICKQKPFIDASRIIQIGIRSVDAREKIALSDTPVQVFDMRQIDELGMRAVMQKAIAMACADGAHLHVSFDVDFLDPTIAPGVPTTVPGGVNYREAQLCMEMIADCGQLGSLDIVELNPAFDFQNKTAELAVELVESIFGKQVLARNPY